MLYKENEMYGPHVLIKCNRPDKYQGVLEIELCPAKDEAECARNSMRWINDHRVRLFLSSPRPCSLSYEEEWVRNLNKGDDIHWMIYVDGTHVGGVGLHRIEKEHARADLGIMIGDQDYWGIGLAQVVTAAVVEYAFENIIPGGLHKLVGHVLVGNDHSQGTLEKIGFAKVGVAREHHWHQGRWYDQWTGEVLKGEWAEMREEKFRATGITYLNIYPGCEEIGFTPAVDGG